MPPGNEKWLPWYWDGVEKVLAEGGTPSKPALHAALKGSEPIPEKVRELLAEVVEHGLPSHRPNFTVWEKEQATWLNRTGDATWEYAYRWSCCKICKKHRNGVPIPRAVKSVDKTNRNGQNPIFHEFVEPDLSPLFASFIIAGPYSPVEAAQKRRNDVVEDVAKVYRLVPVTLQNHVTQTVFRKKSEQNPDA
jgi:hypothetical protein